MDPKFAKYIEDRIKSKIPEEHVRETFKHDFNLSWSVSERLHNQIVMETNKEWIIIWDSVIITGTDIYNATAGYISNKVKNEFKHVISRNRLGIAETKEEVALIGLLQFAYENIFYEGEGIKDLYIPDPDTMCVTSITLKEAIQLIKIGINYIKSIIPGINLDANKYTFGMIAHSRLSVFKINDVKERVRLYPAIPYNIETDDSKQGELYMRELFEGNDYGYWLFRLALMNLIQHIRMDEFICLVEPPEEIVWLLQAIVGKKYTSIVPIKDESRFSHMRIIPSNDHKFCYSRDRDRESSNLYPSSIINSKLIISDYRKAHTIQLVAGDNCGVIMIKPKNRRYDLSVHNFCIISNKHLRDVISLKEKAFWGEVIYRKRHVPFITFSRDTTKETHEIDQTLFHSIIVWAAKCSTEKITIRDVDPNIIEIMRVILHRRKYKYRSKYIRTEKMTLNIEETRKVLTGELITLRKNSENTRETMLNSCTW
jgi:hypothetical protein